MTWPGKHLVRGIPSLTVNGEIIDNAVAGTTGDIRVLMRDVDRKILWATGTDVPADDTAGYAKGCLFIDRDVAAATTGLYVNVGTTADCDFDAVSDA